MPKTKLKALAEDAGLDAATSFLAFIKAVERWAGDPDPGLATVSFA